MVIKHIDSFICAITLPQVFNRGLQKCGEFKKQDKNSIRGEFCEKSYIFLLATISYTL